MKKFFLFIFMAWASSLYPEEPLKLTIENAIDRALENNYSYRISQEQVNQYKKRLMQSLVFLPQVSVDGVRILEEKLQTIEIPPFFPGGQAEKVTLDFTKNYEFRFQLVQPIFTGGKLLYTFKNARLDLDLAREKEKNSRAETVLNTKKMFFNILVLKELLKAQEESLALLENNYANVKARIEQGMASKFDLLRAELAVSSMKPEVLRMENLLEISHLAFKSFLLLPEEQPIELVGEMEYGTSPGQLAALIDSALQNRSEIKQLLFERKKTANLLKIAYAQYLPDFSIIAQYSYRSDFLKFTHKNWENNYTINLGISFPIFTGFKRTGQIGELRVANRMLDLSMKQLNDATRLEIQGKYLTIKQEYENILAGKKNIETAAEGVRVAEASYQEGLITILELNTAYNELTRAKAAYLQALYNYNITGAELEKITGVVSNRTAPDTGK